MIYSKYQILFKCIPQCSSISWNFHSMNFSAVENILTVLVPFRLDLKMLLTQIRGNYIRIKKAHRDVFNSQRHNSQL